MDDYGRGRTDSNDQRSDPDRRELESFQIPNVSSSRHGMVILPLAFPFLFNGSIIIGGSFKGL